MNKKFVCQVGNNKKVRDQHVQYKYLPENWRK